MAQWLLTQGFTQVAVLQGGLDAWVRQGYPVVAMPGAEAVPAAVPTDIAQANTSSRTTSVSPEHALLGAFLPRLAEAGSLSPHELPTKRDMVVLFVDMVRSTALLYSHTVEEVLALIQVFMEEVTEVAVAYCGDVKDFEGDGALLYFEDVGEAAQAAFALREALVAKRRTYPDLPLPRLSLNLGPLIIGIIGSRFRQSIALIGPSLTIAARILKHAPPGGIIATASFLEAARHAHPQLTARFSPDAQQLTLQGIAEGPVTAYLAPPLS